MKRYSVGIDIGSRYAKIVLWDVEHLFIAKKCQSLSGVDPAATAKKLLQEVLHDTSDSQISICATGYGRKLLQGRFVSEISCHAKAVNALHKESRTVIDIGGQDSKVISLDENGNVIEFGMNDKCAAGTGSFLEKVAAIFELPIERLSGEALLSKNEVDMTSTCVVFAESEIVSLINRQIRKEDILMAVHKTIAHRVKNLLSAITWREPIVLTGGVARSEAMCKALEKVLGIRLILPSIPSYTGALGAALFAAMARKE
jgi:(R)-2-hydroxyacyl-CoA dehydratese activating ATPase